MEMTSLGYSLSWIAVSPATRDQLLDVLDLQPTGRFIEVPEVPACGIDLPTGWFVVLLNHVQVTLTAPAGLAELSRTAGVIACFVEEHVMASGACGWSAGAPAWSVSHDGRFGLWHLETSGNLPPEYLAVRDHLLAVQGQETGWVDHVFDVPVALAERLVGFRHDVAPPGGASRPFEVLSPRRIGWRRWMG